MNPYETVRHPVVVKEECGGLVPYFSYAGATIFDLMRYGVSPIVFTGSEEWLPVLKIACNRDGYSHLWETEEYLYPRHGKWVLTKVEP